MPLLKLFNNGTAVDPARLELNIVGATIADSSGKTSITVADQASAQTLTNKTLTAPVLGGTVTGTYTLGGTPTVASPILSGTATGTYTLGGTPTLSSPTISGTATFPTGQKPLIQRGIVPSARINIATDPSDTNTVVIGGHTFKFLTANGAVDTFTQIKRGDGAAASRARFVDAINGVVNANVVQASTPFNKTVVADEVGNTVRIRWATARGGTAAVGTSTSIALSETLADVADIWNCANLNVSGKAEGDVNCAVGAVTITAEMITAGSFDVELPFTPTIVHWDGYTSAGIIRAIDEAVTISTNALALVLAGGVSPNWQAGDVFAFIAIA